MNTSSIQPSAAIPAQSAVIELPTWSAGSVTRTLFVHAPGASYGHPTGVEFRVFNRAAHEQLMAQANLAAKLFQQLRVMTDLAESYGVGNDCDGNLIEAREVLAEATKLAAAVIR